MGVTATARGKLNVFLPVVAAIRVLALVALNFHADYHLLATDGETYEVANPKAVLDQMQMATLGTTFYPLFCFNMQDNGVTFVFLTSALVVIKPKSMI